MMTTGKIPTDAEIVRAFLDERSEYTNLVEQTGNDKSDRIANGRYRGHVEARSDLSMRLDEARKARAEAAQAAAARLTEALAGAAEGFAAFSEALSTAWERAGYAVQVDTEPDTEHDDE